MPSPAKKPAAPAAKNTVKNEAPAKPVTAAPAKPVMAAAAKPTTAKSAVSPAERMKMIAEAAYYLAQKRGFSGGNELSDWVAAEKQVDALVAKRG